MVLHLRIPVVNVALLVPVVLDELVVPVDCVL